MPGSPVVVCSWGLDTTGDGVEDVLAAGKRLSLELGVDLDWLLLGAALPAAVLDVARRHGVAHVDRISHPNLAEPRPDRVVMALERYFAQNVVDVVLFRQGFDARFAAPSLAERLGVGAVMNAIALHAGEGGRLEVTATAFGGDVQAVYAFDERRPAIVALVDGVAPALPAASGAAPDVRDIAVDLSGGDERIDVVQRASSDGPRLEDARVVVAGGRGLGSPEAYRLIEVLAAALGGLPAASRAIVDDGWVDASRQVGLTGKVTKPDLYLAAGISGASQHMAGCSAAKVIVAINSDPDAAIFRYARYGIVGDCQELLRALIEVVEAR